MPEQTYVMDGKVRVDWFMDGETHVDEDLSGRKYDRIVFVGSTFTRCDFSRTYCRAVDLGAGMVRSLYESCVFDGSNLLMDTGDRATFVGCSFRDVRIGRWECQYTSLIDCTFTGSLRGCRFLGRIPDDYPSYIERGVNDIRGNDFSGCRMSHVEFDAGVDLTQQRLPKGPEYFLVPDAPAALAAAREHMQGWSAEDRDFGERLLARRERGVRWGQVQIFGRRSEYARWPGDVGNRIMDFWRAKGMIAG